MTSLVEAIGHARHCPTVCLTADKATAWFQSQRDAEVERLTELVAYFRGLAETVIEVHAEVVMGTVADRELHARAIDAFTTALTVGDA